MLINLITFSYFAIVMLQSVKEEAKNMVDEDNEGILNRSATDPGDFCHPPGGGRGYLHRNSPQRHLPTHILSLIHI